MTGVNRMAEVLRPLVTAIHVGRPRQFSAVEDESDETTDAKPWTSGIIKAPVKGPVMVRRLNIDGDGQADLVHHGGQDKAVLGYAGEHYEFWKSEYPHVDWRAGCFGENLTIRGLSEAEVCVGDVFRLGEARLQISQPRQPCWKLSRRWRLPKLAVRVQQTRRTGWYFRVLGEGRIEAGQTLEVTDRPFPQWTIARANEIMFAKPRLPDEELALARCNALSASWRETLTNRLRRGKADRERREADRLGSEND